MGHDEYFNKPGLGKSTFLQLGWLKPMVKLDIFPYDYVKKEKLEYYNKSYSAYKFSFRTNLFEKENFNFNEEFDRIFEKIGVTLEKTDFIGEGFDATCVDDFGYFNADLIFPMKTMKFENYQLKCPNKPEELLKLWYGENYMDIPSNIVMHGYQEYNAGLFESKKEMDDAFKYTINEIKKINNSFK